MKLVIRKGVVAAVLLALLFVVGACAADSGEEEPTLSPTEAAPAPATISSTIMATVPSTPFVAGTVLAQPPPTLPPQPTSTPQPTPTPITYTVQAGESLGSIAARHSVNADELAALNNLADPNAIVAGQVLTIPHPTPQPGGAEALEAQVTTYIVKAGDTLASIAGFYDVPVFQLAVFNSLADPYVILPGDTLQIPLDGHVVTEGETLDGIAKQYSVSLDGLIALNAGEHQTLPDDPNFILPGWFLQIPRETVVVGYNCDPDPAPRQGVITHTVSFGMELACLSRKFGVEVNTLAWANRAVIVDGGLQDGDVIKVPPADGALYVISENDIASETNVEALTTYYGVTPGDIMTESGDPVTDPIDEVGQLLFIRNAYLLDGPYEPPIIVVAALPEGALGEGGEFIPPSDSTSGYIIPSGEVPAGAIRPKMTPWIGVTDLDTGFCNYVTGAGWASPINWPVDSRAIHPGRAFGGAHGGIDIDSPIGSPVFAAAGGVVVWAGNSVYGAGNLVVLEHGGTFQTYYAHLSEVYVSCGQAVGPGSIIGAVGQTGQSTFPHLHFEVRYAGFAYDPALYLP